MGSTKLGGEPIATAGELPTPGAVAPSFELTQGDLSTVNSSELSGKNVIVNIFPSIDTPTCATSVRTFNQRASEFDNTTVVCVSADLPFALGRFCGAEGIDNVLTTSTFRSPSFGSDYGVLMTDGALANLMARAVVVISPDGTVAHSEMVSDIAEEPNYDAAIASIR